MSAAPASPAHTPSFAEDRMNSAVRDTGWAGDTWLPWRAAKAVYPAARRVEDRSEYCSVAFAPMASGRLGTSLCCPSPVHVVNYTTPYSIDYKTCIPGGTNSLTTMALGCDSNSCAKPWVRSAQWEPVERSTSTRCRATLLNLSPKLPYTSKGVMGWSWKES